MAMTEWDDRADEGQSALLLYLEVRQPPMLSRGELWMPIVSVVLFLTQILFAGTSFVHLLH